ncbi:hypothetical protein JK621_11460 [Serratia plymuthica]|uniref:hypothetical protein n=1 Tax=Serratia plymuthica TaxID=82996 RepID=UPI001BB0CF4F|nr:hypothetical protein [Serratia plymuthica]QUY50718.1 hypothetical protein JK621_11460 [Serratia plymuthica]
MNIDDFTFIFTLTKRVEFDFMFFYMPDRSFAATLNRQCLIKDDVMRDIQGHVMDFSFELLDFIVSNLPPEALSFHSAAKRSYFS